MSAGAQEVDIHQTARPNGINSHYYTLEDEGIAALKLEPLAAKETLVTGATLKTIDSRPPVSGEAADSSQLHLAKAVLLLDPFIFKGTMSTLQVSCWFGYNMSRAAVSAVPSQQICSQMLCSKQDQLQQPLLL